MDETEQKATPHDELCDMALEHYDEISTQAMHSNSLIPKAIEYYKRWTSTGKRKIVYTPGMVMDALNEGWTFDPWLNSRGSPIPIGDISYKGVHPALLPEEERVSLSVYWVLLKGTPEQIAEMNPIAELPEDEEDEPEPPKPVTEADRLALAEDFVEIKPPDTPGVIPKDYAGWTIFKATKGNLQLIKPRAEEPTAWDVAKALAELSTHLGVDQAHDVIQGILNKDFKPVL